MGGPFIYWAGLSTHHLLLYSTNPTRTQPLPMNEQPYSFSNDDLAVSFFLYDRKKGNRQIWENFGIVEARDRCDTQLAIFLCHFMAMTTTWPNIAPGADVLRWKIKIFRTYKKLLVCRDAVVSKFDEIYLELSNTMNHIVLLMMSDKFHPIFWQLHHDKWVIWYSYEIWVWIQSSSFGPVWSIFYIRAVQKYFGWLRYEKWTKLDTRNGPN